MTAWPFKRFLTPGKSKKFNGCRTNILGDQNNALVELQVGGCVIKVFVSTSTYGTAQ